jgi:hypothetical protein
MNADIQIGDAIALAGPHAAGEVIIELDNGRRYRLTPPQGQRIIVELPVNTVAQELLKFHASGCPINKLKGLCNCNRQDAVTGMARLFTPHAN